MHVKAQKLTWHISVTSAHTQVTYKCLSLTLLYDLDDKEDELGKSLDQLLLECGVIKFGDFALVRSQKSKYYVDIKVAATNPIVLKIISNYIVM